MGRGTPAQTGPEGSGSLQALGERAEVKAEVADAEAQEAERQAAAEEEEVWQAREAAAAADFERLSSWADELEAEKDARAALAKRVPGEHYPEDVDYGNADQEKEEALARRAQEIADEALAKEIFIAEVREEARAQEAMLAATEPRLGWASFQKLPAPGGWGAGSDWTHIFFKVSPR